jgi:hypothetical protein
MVGAKRAIGGGSLGAGPVGSTPIASAEVGSILYCRSMKLNLPGNRGASLIMNAEGVLLQAAF